MGKMTDDAVDGILIALKDKYKGLYQKEALGDSAKCDFLLNGRRFSVTPWQTAFSSGFLTSVVSGPVCTEGMSLSCYCQSRSHFWIIEEAKGFLNKLFTDFRVKKSGDQIIVGREGVPYVFKGKDHDQKMLLLKKSEFIKAVQSLACKEMIILRLWENWLTFAIRLYDDSIFQKFEALDQLAGLFEITSKEIGKLQT